MMIMGCSTSNVAVRLVVLTVVLSCCSVSVIAHQQQRQQTQPLRRRTTEATASGSIEGVERDINEALSPSSFSSSLANQLNTSEATESSPSSCYIKRDSSSLEKRVYTVGVLAIRGPDDAYREFNSTFATYLTATAGKRFDPPIEFRMKALDFLTVFSDAEESLVDFIYVNPSAFSCIESEYGARSLASQVSQRVVDNTTYKLKEFGGVIATLADRDDIQSIHDLKGQVIAAASISGLGSGQMQFREMQRAGMSYINDPKQLVFTSDQGKVVNGLLNGEFDVGFVRTDQLERSKDADGNPIDRSLFKVIDPKPSLNINGVPFPFQSSTPLYPEWNIAALPHVPDVVATELQNAMLDVGVHADVAAAKRRCIENNDDVASCDEYIGIPKLCDTADEVADIAMNATQNGKFSNWVPSLSYMELRSMQEATGFIENQNDVWRCLRSAEIYDSISCPAGFLKKTESEVASGCADQDMTCADDFQCICSPCYEPIDCVDSIAILGRCVPYEIFLPALLVPIAVLFIAACFAALGVKSKQMVNQAKQSAKHERDLNEFIAHEVRNPLSAALSASIFVSNAVASDVTEDTLETLRDDASIIGSSLRFINDLLRSMLDVHRATRDQMVLELDTVDIKCDIFQPVSSMIYSRDTNFLMQVDCPEGLVVKTDKLRLQQVILNLARNSAKFVTEGFVRLRAEVIDDRVHLFVEDSGPGIPEDKRNDLFNKYQKSLDSLAQGTGVGLSLVEKLVALMQGSIYLNDGYVSGYKDYQGACMVVDLKQAPCAPSESHDDSVNINDLEDVLDPIIKNDSKNKLPRRCDVLFVDDERNHRMLARRALKQIRPEWHFQEAASGEAALQLCEQATFDIIFMDQYMCSVEQCLKGTEAVRALRTRGVRSAICGLSANNLETVFMESGADVFYVKPFPMDPQQLSALLTKLVCIQSEQTPEETTKKSDTGFDTKRNSLSCYPSGAPPRSCRSVNSTTDCASNSPSEFSSYDESSSSDLPSKLSVLVCDDDKIIRRLATRSLKTLLPDCRIREASDGETALRLCAEEDPDLVFMDQYMTSSSESSLLGTETVVKLRSQGCRSLICGLSANQQAEAFLEAGAEHFILKPLTISDLRGELVKILSKRDFPTGWEV